MNDMHRIALLAVWLLCAAVASAQVWEDFSDGDFSSNPAWVGDTARFRVNTSRQLQLYTDGADTAQLSFPYQMPHTDTITWTLWLKLAFTPTVNNYAAVALYSDSANLLESTEYLMLAVADPASGNDKRISLYQNGQLLVQGNFRLGATTQRLRLKVLCISRSVMELWADTAGGDSYSFLGAAPCASSSQYPADAYFGVLCLFTASRAHGFYFDDIGINCQSDPGNDYDGPLHRVLHPNDLVVNELLFDPPAGGADYVELYNRSDSAVALSDLCLARWDGTRLARLYPVGTHGVIPPHDYLVLTTDAPFVATNYKVLYPGKLLEIGSMPSFPNESGTVVLATTDTVVIDRFDYSAAMHSPMLRDREGVALERRSPDAPSDDPNNWFSAASTAGWGTPTYRNSQSNEVLFVDDDFRVEPTLFSPDGDGYNDLVVIHYALQRCDLAANVVLFDAAGRPVRHLGRGALLGCEGTLEWDGLSDGAIRCQRGNYILAVDAYNPQGVHQHWRKRITIVYN